MNDTERDALLQDIHTKMDDLKLKSQRVNDALFDVNGKKGLCSQVETMCSEVAHHKISITRLWIAVGVIAVGGGGTVGAVELVKRLSGG